MTLDREIDFGGKNHTFLGRNGEFGQQGMRVTLFADRVGFQPITTKNQYGRAFLHLPVDQIDQLIDVLSEMREAHKKAHTTAGT